MSPDWLDPEPPPRGRPGKLRPRPRREEFFSGRGVRGRLLLTQCARKLRHKTEKHAKEVKLLYPDAYVYECPWCRGWHLGKARGRWSGDDMP